MIPFRAIGLGSPSAACGACFPGAGKESPARKLEEILGDVGHQLSRTRAGQRNLLLMGAEPFSHPGLPEIVRAARTGGADRLGLRTDARALVRPENASGSVSSGVSLFELTLAGATSGTHDRLTGVTGGFEASLNGMRTLAATVASAGAVVALRGLIRVCEHNVFELPEVCGIFASVGCSSVRCEVQRSARSKASLPWFQAAATTGMVNGTWVVLAGVGQELLGDLAAHALDPIEVQE